MRLSLGDGLSLRPLRATDLESLLALDADPEVMRHITGGIPASRRLYEEYLLDRLLAPGRADPRLGFFAAELEGRFIGWVHLRPDAEEPAWLEIGYRLRREAWGRGIATRASNALIDAAMRAFPGRGFSARTVPENAASRRVMEKLGFVFAGEGTFPARTVIDLDLPEVPAVLYRRPGARLALDPGAAELLRTPTDAEPWRVLVSACLLGEKCGVNGDDYGLGSEFEWWRSTPRVRFVPFCPEAFSLGVPRTMPDLHGGDGFSALDGVARVLDEHGHDLTDAMIRGGEAMLAQARAERVDFAILTDASAACGTQVISDGCRFDDPRRHQRGAGVAAATLIRGGVPVVAQRDFATLGRLRTRAEPAWVAPTDARDHHRHPWVLEHLPGDPW